MKYKMRTWIVGLAVVVVLIGVGRAVGDVGQTYNIIDLGTLGLQPSSRYGYAVNESGEVVGMEILHEGAERHAFLYAQGTMADLGTLGGLHARAEGIDNSGRVVGWSDTAGAQSHAFLWEQGVGMTDLGTLGGATSYAYAINNSGLVVGKSRVAAGGSISAGSDRAFLWDNGSMMDLGSLGGKHTVAYGINDAGQVVGAGQVPGSVYHAFLYSGGTMSDLGTLYTKGAWAHDINNSLQVVGKSLQSNGYQRAFIWENGVMSDLGTLGGAGHTRSYAINDLGKIVGDSHTSTNTYHAFLWENGTMTDLNDLLPEASGWELHRAYDMNNLGQIVGTGVINGEWRAYLLTPESNVIPAPGAAILGMIGIGMVGAYTRKRRLTHVTEG